MADQETDGPVRKHIERLVKEQQQIYGQKTLSDADRQHLKGIAVELDQCWDLLRQRQALREFGLDPDQARIRPSEIVEKYES
ncbi:MAG TPA: DUF2630 family protein [Methylomirabilota bacterium]|jgi:hypothetical protein|nr:DUF2630 family protein [Methylomirabilota bacterium]